VPGSVATQRGPGSRSIEAWTWNVADSRTGERGGDERQDAGVTARGAGVRRVRALSDELLVQAMRDGDELAWGEFDDRFRPLLEDFARRTGIPRWEWSSCVTEVLDDEALKFATRQAPLPKNLGAYLVRAVHNRRLRLKRAALVGDRYYAAASHAVGLAEHVVVALCSESTIRASAGPEVATEGAAPVHVSSGLARLARILEAELSEDELLLLTWRSAGVPLRQISTWLGIGYDAAAKRAMRLCHRLRAIARLRVESFPPEERRELNRFFRRVDAMSAVSGADQRGTRE
jgi:hypothetical protein